MLGASSQVRVRPAKASDAPRLAEIFSDAWRLAYRGIIPHLHLESIIRRRGPEWWRAAVKSGDSMLILEISGTVAGYASVGMARTKGPYQGEIFEIYLAPTYQGLGFGEHLFEACRFRLDHRRLKGLVVWSLLDNTTATNFYWRRGGRPLASTYDRFGTARLQKVAFVWA